jgi:hypothetical protein
MMKKLNLNIFCLMVLAFIVFLLSGLIACGEYGRFVLRNDLAKCSFEYPSSYSRPTIYNSSQDSISISSGLFSGAKDYSEVDSRISFYIRKSSSSFSNYKALLEFTLNNESKGPGEFKLLDRSVFTIADIEGEKIAYNYSIIREDRKTEKQYLVPAIAYSGYFENKGILWEIDVDAIMEKSDLAKTAFVHVVSSFKFIH